MGYLDRLFGKIGGGLPRPGEVQIPGVHYSHWGNNTHYYANKEQPAMQPPSMQWAPIQHADMGGKSSGETWGDVIGKLGGGLLSEAIGEGGKSPVEGIDTSKQIEMKPIVDRDPSKLDFGFEFGGFRRFGGPMYPGKEYIVGEDGPETVRMHPDGVAQVTPIDDPPAFHPDLQPGAQATSIPKRDIPTGIYEGGNAPLGRLGGEPKLDPADFGTPKTVDPKDVMYQTPGRYSGKEGAGGHVDASPREKVLRDIQDLQGHEWQREKSIWKRIGSGVLDGMRGWAASGGQGGLAGMMGSAIGGATQFGLSPKAQAEHQKKQELGKLFGKYQEAVAPEMMELERRKAINAANMQELEFKNKQTQQNHLENKYLIDSIMADKKVTQSEADQLAARNIRVNPGNWDEYDISYDPVTGEASVVNKTGVPRRVEAPGLHDNPDAVRHPISIKGPDGKETVNVRVSPGKAADTAVGLAQAGATQQMRIEDRKYRRERDAKEDSFKERQLKMQEEKNNLDREMKVIEIESEAIKNDGVASGAKQRLDAAIANYNQLIGQHDNLTRGVPDNKRDVVGLEKVEFAINEARTAIAKERAELEKALGATTQGQAILRRIRSMTQRSQ